MICLRLRTASSIPSPMPLESYLHRQSRFNQVVEESLSSSKYLHKMLLDQISNSQERLKLQHLLLSHWWRIIRKFILSGTFISIQRKSQYSYTVHIILFTLTNILRSGSFLSCCLIAQRCSGFTPADSVLMLPRSTKKIVLE